MYRSAYVHMYYACTAIVSPTSMLQAVLGAHSLFDRYENGRRVVNVKHVEIHPEWDSETFANDIALMKLANVIQLTGNSFTVI